MALSEQLNTSSMASYLAIVAPYLGECIADRERLSRIEAIASVLPLCSIGGLEVRLADQQPCVDFFVRLPYLNPKLPTRYLSSPIWQGIQSICGGMAGGSGVFHEQVARIFLEFDLDEPPPSVPIPGMFLELNTDQPFRPAELLLNVQSVGLPCHHSVAQLANIERCLAGLPKGAQVAHLGMMLSRPGKAVRLVIQHMPLENIVTYLHSLGWQDPTNGLAEILGDLSYYTDALAMLDIDVGDDISPKVGVELYLRSGEMENLPRWKTFFDYLVTRKLASGSKTNSMLAWPGFTQEGGKTSAWSENLAFGDTLLRGVARSLFWRNINHVKLAYQPGLQMELKAYLGFGHNWFPTDPDFAHADHA